jgi:hypothetical protein
MINFMSFVDWWYVKDILPVLLHAIQESDIFVNFIVCMSINNIIIRCSLWVLKAVLPSGSTK